MERGLENIIIKQIIQLYTKIKNKKFQVQREKGNKNVSNIQAMYTMNIDTWFLTTYKMASVAKITLHQAFLIQIKIWLILYHPKESP